MGEYGTPGARGILFGLVSLAVVFNVAAGEVDQAWMPETLPGLVRAMEIGIARELTRVERVAISEATREDLRVSHPELHAKISRSYAYWTDEWLRRAEPQLEDVSPRRRQRAEDAAARVDDRLRSYFESRGWRYRSPEIVFLPGELMREPGLPEIGARGMYVVFYPDAFFATLESTATTDQTLIHESFHFNKTGPGLGRTLSEGICEAAARQLSLEWGMATLPALRQANAYPAELQVVERIVRRMVELTGMRREQAIEALLHTYLTGDATEVELILGAGVWSEIVEASRAARNVRKIAKRALGS